jgi:hypothetical protein
MSTSESEHEAESKDLPPLSLRKMNSITFAGLIMIYTSLAAFGTAAYFVYKSAGGHDLTNYVPGGFASGIGVFSALLGVKLVRAGGLSPSDPLPVVNPVEWKILAAAITDNKDDPVGQYIRLSSLTGATGLFTKLGLSGLPLATIGLTIFFAVISLFADKGLHFYELTQLTLGAFIGSFVQKQVGAIRDGGAKGPGSLGGSGGSTTTPVTDQAGALKRPEPTIGADGNGSAEAARGAGSSGARVPAGVVPKAGS